MAAKSLKCTQCGKLLASVREAQSHNEITGHTAFEETTEEIKVMKCTQCGKPCRTDAERGLHTRMNPGHDQYVEEALYQALDTEKQMQQAREEAMEVDDDDPLVAALKAKKAAAKKDKEGAAGGSSGAAAAGEAGGSSGAAEGGEAGGSGQQMVEPVVDEAVVGELVNGMGFGRNRAVRAVYHTGGAGVEAAANWLMEHENDADLDTPLMVTQASEDQAAKLTPEERKKKAQELIKAARERREREEKELAAHRERERIRAGKEMLKAKQEEDELAVKRMIEQRQREKEEEARAREKLRLQLEEDRKERRRKLGLPEELTEEEKKREAEKAAAAAKAAEEEAKKKVFGHVKPITVLEKLRTTLVNMKKVHATDEEKWKTAAGTLIKYIGNVARAPEEEKFRTIKMTNAAFQQRVAGAAGGVEFLELCGFVKSEDGEALSMPQDKVNIEVLNGAGALLQDMSTNPFFGAL